MNLNDIFQSLVTIYTVSIAKIALKSITSRLKHLEFVRVVWIFTGVTLSTMYEWAKRNSGSLKPIVEKAENAVTPVAGPVYERFENLLSDLLVFLDQKVDEAIIMFDKYAPPFAKKFVSQAKSLVLKASEVIVDLVQKALAEGINAAILHGGTLVKNFMVSQVTSNPIAQMGISTATNLSEKYNQGVKDMTAKGYNVVSHLPFIPVDEMTKAYRQVQAAATKKDDDAAAAKKDDDAAAAAAPVGTE